MSPPPQLSCHQSRNWNPEFDFWKFVAAIFIVICHTLYIFGGRVVGHGSRFATEYFFVLSGWLFAQSIFRDKSPFDWSTVGDENIQFLKRKIRAFAVPYAFGWVAAFCVAAASGGLVHRLNKNGLLFELLLLGETGLAPGSSRELILAPSWYLSSLLLTFGLSYPFFRANKPFFADWVAPVFAVFGIGLLVRFSDEISIGPVGACLGPISVNLLRGSAEIMLGIAAYRVSGRIANSLFIRNNQICFRYIGSLLPCIAFGYLASGKATYELSSFAFAVSICFSGAGLSFASKFPQRFCRKLGELSIWLYLLHWSVAKSLELVRIRNVGLPSWFGLRDTKSIALTLTLYLSLCFLLAIVAMLGWDAICRKRAKTPA